MTHINWSQFYHFHPLWGLACDHGSLILLCALFFGEIKKIGNCASFYCLTWNIQNKHGAAWHWHLIAFAFNQKKDVAIMVQESDICLLSSICRSKRIQMVVLSRNLQDLCLFVAGKQHGGDEDEDWTPFRPRKDFDYQNLKKCYIYKTNKGTCSWNWS